MIGRELLWVGAMKHPFTRKVSLGPSAVADIFCHARLLKVVSL